MSLYSDWGFWQTPFQTTPLRPDDQGLELLVGRHREVTQLKNRLRSSSRIITFEGNNGIGKTSLVNVGVHECMMDALRDPTIPFFVPCSVAFQLRTDSTADEFIEQVYLAVGQTLVAEGSALRARLSGRAPQALDRWLNDPTLTNIQAGIGAVASFGRSDSTNQSEGFRASGIRRLVKGFLSEVFKEGNHGGIVCIIDNLEILRTSATARHLLEVLRDEILITEGLRWVVCGSNGIVRGAFSSSRMEGHYYPPIEVGGIEKRDIPKILSSRVNVFSKGNENPYLPFTERDFIFTHERFNSNLRATLGHLDNYCLIMHESEDLPETEEEKRECYLGWFQGEAAELRRAIEDTAPTRALQLFDHAVANYSSGFSPGDYADFGFSSREAFRPYVKTLEDLGLLTSERDESDQRRRTSQLTAKAWVFQYGREFKF